MELRMQHLEHITRIFSVQEVKFFFLLLCFFELMGRLACHFGDMVPVNSPWFPGAEMINSCQGFFLPMRDAEEPFGAGWSGRMGEWTGRKSRITGGSKPHAPGILLEDYVCDRVIDWSWKKSQDLLGKWACLLPSIPSLPWPPSLFFCFYEENIS